MRQRQPGCLDPYGWRRSRIVVNLSQYRMRIILRRVQPCIFSSELLQLHGEHSDDVVVFRFLGVGHGRQPITPRMDRSRLIGPKAPWRSLEGDDMGDLARLQFALIIAQCADVNLPLGAPEKFGQKLVAANHPAALRIGRPQFLESQCASPSAARKSPKSQPWFPWSTTHALELDSRVIQMHRGGN